MVLIEVPFAKISDCWRGDLVSRTLLHQTLVNAGQILACLVNRHTFFQPADRRQPPIAFTLLGIFAALALSLAAVGIYGVMAYNVGRRTREFGIRLALGASGYDVKRSVFLQGSAIVGIGIACGLLGAFLLSRLIRSMLYGVAATDPLTFVLVPVTLALVALVAGYLPARRATRVDPVRVLRQE